MYGIRNIWRFTALAGLCAVVAPGTAAQSQTFAKSPKVIIKVQPTSASFVFTTSKPTRAVLSYGTGKGNLVPLTDSSRRKHRITVRSLTPLTNYVACIKVTSARGGSSLGCKKFKTSPVTRATAVARDGRVLINGTRFIPIKGAIYDSCPTGERVSDFTSLGANVLDNYEWPCRGTADTAESLHDSLDGRVWWIERRAAAQDKVRDLPELLRWQVPGDASFVPSALVSCNSRSTVGVYESLRAMTRSSHVTYAMWLANKLDPRRNSCLDGPRVAAVFWTAIIAGVRSFEYRSQYDWDIDARASVTVDDDVRVQAKKQAQQLATLAPVLLYGRSLPEPHVESIGDSVRAAAWKYGGMTYIIAVNTESQSSTATIKVASLNGRAKVMWGGGRRVRVRNSSVTDNFSHLGVHIYQVLPAVK